MYDVLETIYRDMLKMFGVKQFHLGGDEIHLGCWNSSFDITKWLEDRGQSCNEDLCGGPCNGSIIGRESISIIHLLFTLKQLVDDKT